MTIIYMDSAMKLKAPLNEGQLSDWQKWNPGVKIGHFNSPINPISIKYKTPTIYILIEQLKTKLFKISSIMLIILVLRVSI